MGVTVISSKSQFDEVIKSDRPAIFDFHATWCGPCHAISPVFAKLSDEYVDADYYTVDVDDQPEVAQECSISAMPTFIVYQGGKSADKFMGAVPAKLESMIKKATGKA